MILWTWLWKIAVIHSLILLRRKHIFLYKVVVNFTLWLGSLTNLLSGSLLAVSFSCLHHNDMVFCCEASLWNLSIMESKGYMWYIKQYFMDWKCTFLWKIIMWLKCKVCGNMTAYHYLLKNPAACLWFQQHWWGHCEVCSVNSSGKGKKVPFMRCFTSFWIFILPSYVNLTSLWCFSSQLDRKLESLEVRFFPINFHRRYKLLFFVGQLVHPSIYFWHV